LLRADLIVAILALAFLASCCKNPVIQQFVIHDSQLRSGEQIVTESGSGRLPMPPAVTYLRAVVRSLAD